MAESIQVLIDRLRDYEQQIREVIPLEVIEENKTFLEDYNVMQLSEGERADGVILPDYSPVSVHKYGKPPGPIKLFDTGAFYRGIIAVMNPTGVEMEGRDSKTEKLKADFGADILGVTENNFERFQQDIMLSELQKKTHEFLTS